MLEKYTCDFMLEHLPREVRLFVSKPVAELGIEVRMAAFAGARITNKDGALEQYKKEKIPPIKLLDLNHSILQEYGRLQRVCGIKEPKAPAQWLIELVKKNDRLPNINTVVDSYNIVSAETLLSIGAHDLDKIKGEIYFRITKGDEKYTPLGSSTTEKVNAGEYAATDEEKIICRLDLKQCDETKITKETRQFIVYVQGNKNTPSKLLGDALQQVCDNMKRFCGGTCRIIKQNVV